MPTDDDLIKKILSLPERKRSDFLGFFGANAMSRREIDELERNLAASFALKFSFGSVKAS